MPFSSWLAAANGSDKLPALAVKTTLEERDTFFISDAFNGSSTARNEVGYLLVECISAKLENGMTLEQLIDTAFQDALDECLFQGG